MKKILSIVLVLSLTLAMSANAFAVGENSVDNSTTVAYSDLPDDVQSVISPDAKISVEADGVVNIYQDAPLLPTTQTGLREIIDRYSPNGGTSHNLSSPYLPESNNTLMLVYESYVPAEAVLSWAVGSTTGAVERILVDAAAGFAIGAIVETLASIFGLTIPAWFVSAVIAAGGIAHYTIFEMNKATALEKLRDSGSNGIIVDYIMRVYDGTTYRVITPWNNHPYALMRPNGGVCDWAAGAYYAIN